MKKTETLSIADGYTITIPKEIRFNVNTPEGHAIKVTFGRLEPMTLKVFKAVAESMVRRAADLIEEAQDPEGRIELGLNLTPQEYAAATGASA